MLINNLINCPYCGETFNTQIDCSVHFQEYIEDCYVCCQPIVFAVSTDGFEHVLNIEIKRDNE